MVWSGLAILATAFSYSVDDWFGTGWAPRLADGVVEDLLRILASSMLVVSTFALSILVSAFASASTTGTPRATKLVVADPRAQSTVAVFLAAFIFSIVGVIALGLGTWGPEKRFVLFCFASLVLARVIYAFMEYIQLLTRIGRVEHTLETVEGAALRAMRAFVENPLVGAQVESEPRPGALPLLATEVGFVQLVVAAALERVCRRLECDAHVAVRTGDLVDPGRPLLFIDISRPLQDKEEQSLRDAIVVGPHRSIEQDAGYGLLVLAEIAQRALSPAVHDPGTAIAVMGSQTRVLVEALARWTNEPRVLHEHVYAPLTDPSGIVRPAFDPIARAGATELEVLRQLLRHLDVLARTTPEPFAGRAREQAEPVVTRARVNEIDADDLRSLHRELRRAGP